MPENGGATLQTCIRGCDGGHALSCKEACFKYIMKALSDAGLNAVTHSYRTRGCELNEPMSCTLAGDVYLKGAPGVSKDYQKARPMLEKGCAEDMSSACAYLAQVYAYSWGVEADLEKARAYINRARSRTDDNTVVDNIIAELKRNFR